MVVTEYTWKLHNFVLDDVVYEDTRRVVVSTFLREYDTNADSLRSKYESWLFFIGNHEKTNFMDIAQVAFCLKVVFNKRFRALVKIIKYTSFSRCTL